jgi:hypothetical protein
MNISEFERNKPTQTYALIYKAKEKYEKILKETVIMDDEDRAKVSMASEIHKDLKKIFESFIKGE